VEDFPAGALKALQDAQVTIFRQIYDVVFASQHCRKGVVKA